MHIELDTRRESATAYTRPQTREELVAEGLACIISGREFPRHLRAAPPPITRPATAEAGIAQMLAGPNARVG